MDLKCPHYDKAKYDPEFTPKKRGNEFFVAHIDQIPTDEIPVPDTDSSAGSIVAGNVDEDEAGAILNAIYARLKVFHHRQSKIFRANHIQSEKLIIYLLLF